VKKKKPVHKKKKPAHKTLAPLPRKPFRPKALSIAISDEQIAEKFGTAKKRPKPKKLIVQRLSGTCANGEALTCQLEWRRCGKLDCFQCPHGPYWYAYWLGVKHKGRRRRHSIYLGKKLDAAAAARVRRVLMHARLPKEPKSAAARTLPLPGIR
jgi:hypothetical protein